ncbi:conserved Plasmodium protein, unknown function [Plasmodium ovale wallikeri]|uniref:Uncharacterized protein n=2 Tax=Plasmodium ovale TaxID=36330 RepID=A0A1C3KN38_PLAOA|nr:conserved Plasmodium protein, unknown function [Plasmodium ovale wallikeri]SBT75452.1 conserved Plasmodium protein, unknown function [Plasmodium ovale]
MSMFEGMLIKSSERKGKERGDSNAKKKKPYTDTQLQSDNNLKRDTTPEVELEKREESCLELEKLSRSHSTSRRGVYLNENKIENKKKLMLKSETYPNNSNNVGMMVMNSKYDEMEDEEKKVEEEEACLFNLDILQSAYTDIARTYSERGNENCPLMGEFIKKDYTTMERERGYGYVAHISDKDIEMRENITIRGKKSNKFYEEKETTECIHTPLDEKEKINELFYILQNVFRSNQKWNVTNLNDIFKSLLWNNVQKNVLPVVYFFIYHTYVSKKILNLKDEYNCDELLYKLLFKIHKIRKKRKKCKEKEKFYIIKENLDYAHVIQKRIYNYNLKLAQMELNIAQLFKKKTYIHYNNRVLKIFVNNILKIIIRYIRIKKKKEKKNEQLFFNEKKESLFNQESKIREKEKEITKEEIDIEKKKKEIEEKNELIKIYTKQIEEKFDEQLHKVCEQINCVDKSIKELERQIEHKKMEKLNAIQIKANLEKEKKEELDNLLAKKKDLNTSINFVKNTQELINEKKIFILNEKEKVKEASEMLSQTHRTCSQKRCLTNRLIANLYKIIQQFDDQHDEVAIPDGNSVDGFLPGEEHKWDDSTTREIQLRRKERQSRSYIVNYSHSMEEIFILRKIYMLKKKLLQLEKESNRVKEKKKQLMIDISQFNCEMENINIKKENLKNKKKVLLKNKMLNEIKNVIHDYDELEKTEEVILKQLQKSIDHMNDLKKKHLDLKDEREALKRKSFILEGKLLKREEVHARRWVISIRKDEPVADTKEVNANEADTKEVNANEVNTNEADTKEVNANEVNTNKADTKEVNANEVNTNEADTKEVNTNKADTKEVNANEVPTNEADTNEADTNEVPTNEADTNEVPTNGENAGEEKIRDGDFLFSEESELEEEDYETKIVLKQVMEEMVSVNIGSDDAVADDVGNDCIMQDDAQEIGEMENSCAQSKDGEDGESGEETPTGEYSDALSEGDSSEMEGENPVCSDNNNVETDINVYGDFPVKIQNVELQNMTENIKMEENRIFEEILSRYKDVYILHENVNHSILEEESYALYNDIVKEENILKTNKLFILRKKKTILKKYYQYASENSEEEEINI